jgi:hypothetical protein
MGILWKSIALYDTGGTQGRHLWQVDVPLRLTSRDYETMILPSHLAMGVTLAIILLVFLDLL